MTTGREQSGRRRRLAGEEVRPARGGDQPHLTLRPQCQRRGEYRPQIAHYTAVTSSGRHKAVVSRSLMCWLAGGDGNKAVPSAGPGLGAALPCSGGAAVGFLSWRRVT